MLLKPLKIEWTDTGPKAIFDTQELERLLSPAAPARFKIEGIPVSGNTELVRQAFAEGTLHRSMPEDHPKWFPNE
jgi:hypothetical protein